LSIGEHDLIDTIAIVERNDRLVSAAARSYGRLRLRLAHPLPTLPGQFAMLKPRGLREPLLRRAMAYYRTERSESGISVEFIYQVLGRGTQALSALRAGDEVDFLGSLGNTFDIEAAKGRQALLVAGGVGSAALYMLAEELSRRQIPTALFIGGASRGDLCGLEDFALLLSETNLFSATVDGSYGEKGFVTAPLEEYLRKQRHTPKLIFACGPDPMLHRVSQIADKYDVRAQLSLESPMACGFGICVGCAVAVKADCPEGFLYKKVCTDGPVFWNDELRW
jgi:dihydroorotate dehydrogenase electron transfer subunit